MMYDLLGNLWLGLLSPLRSRLCPALRNSIVSNHHCLGKCENCYFFSADVQEIPMFVLTCVKRVLF